MFPEQGGKEKGGRGGAAAPWRFSKDTPFWKGVGWGVQIKMWERNKKEERERIEQRETGREPQSRPSDGARGKLSSAEAI